MSDFSLSDSAIKRVSLLISKEKAENSFLRITVDGGGCSGFQYKFDFDTEIKDDDIVIEQGAAKVAIDSMSLDFLKSGQLDYVEELGGAFFTIRNPNASSTCGCGNSFAV